MHFLKKLFFNMQRIKLLVDIWLYVWKTQEDVTLIYKSNTKGKKKKKTRKKLKKCLTSI